MLTTLRRIVLDFSRTSDLNEALLRLVGQLKEAMNTQCCSVYLADHQKQHFLLMASDGLALNAFGRTSIGFTEGLIGLVGQREEPINIANAQQHPDFIHAPEVEEDEYNAFLGTPIIHQRKVIGVLTIQQKQARYFTENEEAFLVTLAAQLATSMASAEAKNIAVNQYNNGKFCSTLKGIGGAPGVIIGEMVVLHRHTDLNSILMSKANDSAQQKLRFNDAVKKTHADFEAMGATLKGIISDGSLDIFEMYKQLLDNNNIGDEVRENIQLGWSAESALKLMIDRYIAQFEALEDEYLRERASDIKDLGNRILDNLLGHNDNEQALPKQFILVAENVSASMLAQYQDRGLIALVSLTGSNNSHAAILARALNLPAIMGVEHQLIQQLDQCNAIIDGYTSTLYVSPNDALLHEYQHIISEEQQLLGQIMQVADLPAVTKDGHSTELLINAGLSSGFEHSQHIGACGIGLYRTEIPFMTHSCFPSEKAQTKLYRQVLESFAEQPVVMRTLDIGGDKSLPYFPIVEENPFLGWRGIRITLDHPELFLLQVRAMMTANLGLNNLAIMLPMVSSISELDEAIRLINQAYFELSSELNLIDGTSLHRPQIGVMIEVPGIIFQLEELAQKVDFFSVGSNDLTQYLLAVDRNNTRVASLYDFYHPAVLRALAFIAKESNKYHVPLSLCGELAHEPAGALLLIAMGYDKLSMNSHSIAKIKWTIRHVNQQQIRVILSKVLTLNTTKSIRSYLNEQLDLLGLGVFVHPGK